MRLLLLSQRQDWIVAHPVTMGFGWGARTGAIIALFNFWFGSTAFEVERMVKTIAILTVLGPAWGYLTRWAILRERNNAH